MMSNSFENDKEDDSESFHYDISVSLSKQTDFGMVKEIKKIKQPNTISSIQITLSSLSNLEGLNKFTSITHLDLSNNQIVSIENAFFSLQKLVFLDLSLNKIASLEGIESLEKLEHLNVENNQIGSLEPLSLFTPSQKRRLIYLNIKGNRINDTNQYDYLTDFTSLKTLLADGRDKQSLGQISNNDNNFSGNNTAYYPMNPNPFCSIQPHHITSPIRPNNNNVNTINRKHFMNNTINAQYSNMNLYKEEMKNLQNNIQDMYKDQKNLIFQYEQDQSKWSVKVHDLEQELNRVLNENRGNRIRLEEQESSIKDYKYKVNDLQKDNSQARQYCHDKEADNNDLTIKLAQIKKDYELTLIEKNKLIQLTKDYSMEINELKDSIRNMKANYDKGEHLYKDLLAQKTDEVNERMRKISTIENSLYDFNKQVSDKQKEIDSLIESNNTLQQNVIKANKARGEIEFELSQKMDKELNAANEKYKTSIEEIEKKYNMTLANKTEECLNDIKSLEKHYESLLNDISDKVQMKEKENEKLRFGFEECKDLLKSSLEKEDQQDHLIMLLKTEKETLTNDYNSLQVKCKSFELELKDINTINTTITLLNEKNKEEVKKRDNTIEGMGKEIKAMNKELKDKSDIIEDAINQINSLKNRPDLDELNEEIKTKTMIIEDQANQLITQQRNTAAREEEMSRLKSKNDKMHKKIEQLCIQLKEYEEHNREREEKMGQYDTEIAEYERKLKEKEEIFNLIQEHMNSAKITINDMEKKMEQKKREIQIQNEKVEELNNIIILQREENKEIIKAYEMYKNDKERLLNQYTIENEEMKNELRFLINEYEKLKQQNDKYQEGILQFNQLMNPFQKA